MYGGVTRRVGGFGIIIVALFVGLLFLVLCVTSLSSSASVRLLLLFLMPFDIVVPLD